MNDQSKTTGDEVSLNLPDFKLDGDMATAVDEIRSLQVPSDIVQRAVTLASVDPTFIQPNRSPTRHTSQRWAWTAVAATIATVVVGAMLLSQPKNLLAQMQEAVAKANSIRFVSRILDGDDKVLTEIESLVMEPRSIRQEFKDGKIVIADITSKRGLTIDKANKTASRFSLEGVEASTEFFDSVMSIVRGAENQIADEVRRTTVDGKTLVEYEVETDAWKARVTIDEQTKMPIRIVLPVGDAGQRLEATDFALNQDLDAGLFALNVPVGFKLIEIEKSKPASINDSNLILTQSGMDPVRFGFSTADVIKHLGEPDIVGHPVGEGRTKIDVLNYNYRGIQIIVGPDVGVTAIVCTDDSSEYVNEGFAGQFDGGVEIGDGMESVIKTLGKPNKQSKDNDWVVYSSQEEKTEMTFRFENAKLSSVHVRKLLAEKK